MEEPPIVGTAAAAASPLCLTWMVGIKQSCMRLWLKAQNKNIHTTKQNGAGKNDKAENASSPTPWGEVRSGFFLLVLGSHDDISLGFLSACLLSSAVT